MKLTNLLLQERLVNSSWLQDVSYFGRHNRFYPGEEIITFKTKGNNKLYIVRGCVKQDYLDWMKSPSKGKFFHMVKKKFNRDWYLDNPFRPIHGLKVRPTKKVQK